MSDETIDRQPAEGEDPDAEVVPVLPAEGKPSQAEGEDPDAETVPVIDPQ